MSDMINFMFWRGDFGGDKVKDRNVRKRPVKGSFHAPDHERWHERW